MSHRSGSNINSPLFMMDPVPIRNNKNQNLFSNNNRSFIVKGEDDATTYEYKGGENDMFIIDKKEKGSYQFHRNALKESLLELKTQANCYVANLSNDHRETFNNTVEAIRLIYESPTLYSLILEDINGIFSDVTKVIPGTIAAYFIGCSSNDKFTGPLGCSPK